MRLPRQSLLLLLLLTSLCLLIGVVLGLGSEPLAVRAPVASPTTPRTTPSRAAPQPGVGTGAPILQSTNRQMAFLIVGVDDASVLQPKLEGCWLIAFSAGVNQYYVLNIPREARFQVASLGSSQPLSEVYVQDVQQEVGYRFMRDAVRSVFPAMTIQAVVTVDRSDAADLTTKLGGVTVGGQLLEGPALAAAYDTAAFGGPAARASFQQQAFQAIFHALGDQHWTPASVAVYLEQLPHAVSANDAATLNQLAGNAPSLQASELKWTVVGSDRKTAPAP